MHQWILNMYRSLFLNNTRSALKLPSYDNDRAKEKLGDALNLAAKRYTFYKPFKQLPFSMWPIMDENLKDVQDFQDSLTPSNHNLHGHLNLLSKSEMDLYEQLIHHRKEIYFEHVLGFYCSHQNICFPKAFYWIEKAWVDEAKGRFVPIVTTLTRKKSALIRFRLNQVFKKLDEPCECAAHSMVVSSVRTVEEVLYLPHLFEKRLLPIFVDELEQFFNLFSTLQVKKIIQKSLLSWHVHVANMAVEQRLNEDKILSQLQQFLMSHQVKCPEIQWVESHLCMESLPLQVEKEYQITS